MIPEKDIWIHINRAAQQEIYRSMTGVERKAYDKYVQDCYNRHKQEYFTIGGRNPDTVAYWNPDKSLPAWLKEHRNEK